MGSGFFLGGEGLGEYWVCGLGIRGGGHEEGASTTRKRRDRMKSISIGDDRPGGGHCCNDLIVAIFFRFFAFIHTTFSISTHSVFNAGHESIPQKDLAAKKELATCCPHKTKRRTKMNVRHTNSSSCPPTSHTPPSMA